METVKWGTFLDNRKNVLARVQYMQTAQAYIFDLEADFLDQLPNELLMLPDDAAHDSRPFAISLPKATSFPKASDDTHRIVKGFRILAVSTPPAPPAVDKRNDFRVEVSFDITVQSDFFKDARSVSVKNMSAGGILFISKDEYPKNTKIQFSLPISSPAIHASGVIVNQIPVNKTGYSGFGVRFDPLPASTESAIRKYIFEQQMVQIRRQRDREL